MRQGNERAGKEVRHETPSGGGKEAQEGERKETRGSVCLSVARLSLRSSYHGVPAVVQRRGAGGGPPEGRGPGPVRGSQVDPRSEPSCPLKEQFNMFSEREGRSRMWLYKIKARQFQEVYPHFKGSVALSNHEQTGSHCSTCCYEYLY